jgi:hypothetical protein
MANIQLTPIQQAYKILQAESTNLIEKSRQRQTSINKEIKALEVEYESLSDIIFAK